MSNKMRPLIKGETLDIDNHRRGDGTPISFGSGIHVHKRMNKDQYSGSEILIPLDKEQEYLIRSSRGKKKDIDRLRSEINKALKDNQKRHDFVEDILKGLERKCYFKDETEKIDALYTTAKNIMRHFGIIGEAVSPIIKNDEESFETVHYDQDRHPYYILQDLKGSTIHIGDSKDFVENWDVIDWNA